MSGIEMAYCAACDKQVPVFHDDGRRRFSVSSQRCYWHSRQKRKKAAAKAKPPTPSRTSRMRHLTLSARPVICVFDKLELPCKPTDRSDMARRLVSEGVSGLYGAIDEIIEVTEDEDSIVVQASMRLPDTCTPTLMREKLRTLVVAEQKRRGFRSEAA